MPFVDLFDEKWVDSLVRLRFDNPVDDDALAVDRSREEVRLLLPLCLHQVVTQ